MSLSLPEQLYIEPTNRCNSLCETCVRTFEEQEPPRDLTLDEFRERFDEFMNAVRETRFSPRDYILENLTLKKCAEQYLRLAEKTRDLKNSC